MEKILYHVEFEHEGKTFIAFFTGEMVLSDDGNFRLAAEKLDGISICNGESLSSYGITPELARIAMQAAKEFEVKYRFPPTDKNATGTRKEPRSRTDLLSGRKGKWTT